MNIRRKGFYALSMEDLVTNTDLQLLEVLEHDSFGKSITEYTCLNKHTTNVHFVVFVNLKVLSNTVFSQVCNPRLNMSICLHSYGIDNVQKQANQKRVCNSE